MPTYEHTSLWAKSLGMTTPSPASNASLLERLRVEFAGMRSRAATMATAIAANLPDFTVHDITHADALWECASTIIGDDYPINPCEAFAIGGAFLIHDLGMSAASYPNGLADLKQLAIWKDIVGYFLRTSGHSSVTANLLESPGPDIEQRAICELLRLNHATHAAQLATQSWRIPGTSDSTHLIQDDDLRAFFGQLIGSLAASHWLPVDVLSTTFPNTPTAAYPGFPTEWSIDALTLACILRCADYSHIDDRRAPTFARVVQNPSAASLVHWTFQNNLTPPCRDRDQIVYASKRPFTAEEAPGWWLCYDTIRAIDNELRSVDRLLADSQRKRFAVNGVSHSSDPHRLSRLIRVDGWRPVDAQLHVSAAAKLVGTLGGDELYGGATDVPLRELLQNAADAIRARRALDHLDDDWGQIVVTTGNDIDGEWIEIADNGVGMSERVLSGPLVDFGSSFWGSQLMTQQLPGLAASGFVPTGKYGIGFFSVFIWGQQVEVVSRRFDLARSDTLVLRFSQGVDARPVLRNANQEELLREGGTRVRVWFSSPDKLSRMCSSRARKLSLRELCARIAPCLDATIKVASPLGSLEVAVSANDWKHIDQTELLQRISPEVDATNDCNPLRFSKAGMQLKPVSNADGDLVGRIAIWPIRGKRHTSYTAGIVTAGGLRSCDLMGISGVLIGASMNAARDFALPVISADEMSRWGEGERAIWINREDDDTAGGAVAEILAAIGVSPFGLLIAEGRSGPLRMEDISDSAKEAEEVILVQDAAVRMSDRKQRKVELFDRVFAVSTGRSSLLWHLDFTRRVSWPTEDCDSEWGDRGFYSRTVMGWVIRAVAAGWECSLRDVIASTQFSSDDDEVIREIGQLSGRPFRCRVSAVMRRPKS